MNVQPLVALHARHQELGRYTVIEGDPGVGKTAAITAAATRADNIVVLKEIDHLEEGANAEWDDPRWVQDWYITRERKRQKEVRRLLAAGNHVLQDRSLLSTLAFVYASRGQFEPEGFLSLVQRLATGPKFIAPDTLVIMQVVPSISVQRRRAFSETREYNIWFDAHFLARFHSFFRSVASAKVAGETIVVDTTAMNLSEVERRVARLLQPLAR